MGSLDPRLYHDTLSTIVVILSRCDKSFLLMKYDSASVTHIMLTTFFEEKKMIQTNYFNKKKSSVVTTVSIFF